MKIAKERLSAHAKIKNQTDEEYRFNIDEEMKIVITDQAFPPTEFISSILWNRNNMQGIKNNKISITAVSTSLRF